MQRTPSRKELDDAFDILCSGGLDPTPIPYRFNARACLEYCRANNKKPTELTDEEKKMFIYEE